MRRPILALLAAAALVAVTGCANTTQATPTAEPNPLVPAKTASATVGNANEKLGDTQRQIEDLNDQNK